MIYALMRAVLVMKITQLLLNDLFMNKIMLFNKKEKKILFCFDFIMSFFVNGKKKTKKINRNMEINSNRYIYKIEISKFRFFCSFECLAAVMGKFFFRIG